MSENKRRSTRQVFVGSIGIGSNNPIRIQSMTTTDTKDIESTVDQIKKLSDNGCEIVRATVQGKKEALATEKIKNKLLQDGYDIPIVADIHFYPPAALLAAEFVDKVRINPGNFADKRATFKVLEYSDDSYLSELARIEERFTPLVLKCKKLKKPIRIGANHGSLSDRIMNRFGDTALGMVESAIEFTNIARRCDFHDLVFSMKSSNTKVMLEAYRLLVKKFNELGWDYPLHLGVTEAGFGNEGRIKSSLGIGSLLLDGIGDTIRISLTEDPVNEIDPCRRLVNFAEKESSYRLFFPYSRKKRSFSDFLHKDGTVILKTNSKIDFDQVKSEVYPDIIWTNYPSEELFNLAISKNIKVLSKENKFSHLQIYELDKLTDNLPDNYAILLKSFSERDVDILAKLDPNFIILSLESRKIQKARDFFDLISNRNLNIPIILDFTYKAEADDIIVQFAAEAGSLLCDNIADGICLSANLNKEDILSTCFSVLQSARMRTVKTEFISCPSCGRTLFDLQEVAKRIRAKTGHLPGVKIAIMGCIVNGPGEMADADFGYVGSSPNKVDLYVGKKCIEKNIDFSVADLRLIDLIKAHGRWVEPDNSDKCRSRADKQLA